MRTFLIGGGCRVVGADVDTTQLRVAEVAHGPLCVIRHDDGTVEVTHAPTRMARLRSKLRGRRQRSRATVSLIVPHECAVYAHGMRAQTEIRGMTGPVSVRSGEGEVSLSELAGPVEVHSYTGRVGGSGLSGPVVLRTYSADAALTEVTGSVRAETISGTLAVDAVADPGVHLQLASVSGPLVLGLPYLADVHVRLASTSGRIVSRFPELAVPVADADGHSLVEAAIGLPVAQVWARTDSGDITAARPSS